MTKKTAEKIIDQTLRSLGWFPSDPEYQAVFDKAIQWHDVKVRSTLKCLVYELEREV